MESRRIDAASRAAHRAAAAAAVLALLALPSCDWLKASGPQQRVSPFLSDLRIVPAGVLCGDSFTISFRHDDPQNDISLLVVTFQHTQQQAVRERRLLWVSEGDLNLASAGRASLAHQFACTDPDGRWVVTVWTEDERGHTSNTLAGEVSLNSAG